MSRVIIIGDVHGCLAELLELVEKTGFNPKEDRLILAGDLVDRGPQSVDVVKWARENAEIVRGNHDDRYVKLHQKMQWHKDHPKDLKPQWLKNYPDRIVIYKGLSEDDHQWLAEAPVRIWLPEHKTVVVHAGFKPGVPLEEQDDNSMMHVRFLYQVASGYVPARLSKDNDYSQPLESVFWADLYDGDWNVVYGHHVWDYDNIQVHENNKGIKCYGIDTGCCFGGSLSALILSENCASQIIQVKAKKRYSGNG